MTRVIRLWLAIPLVAAAVSAAGLAWALGWAAEQVAVNSPSEDDQ